MVDTADRHLPATLSAPAPPQACAPADVRVRALPFIDPGRRIDLTAPAGTSVQQIVRMALPAVARDPAQAALVRVTIGDMVVPQENWARVKPRPGTSLVLRVMPGSGNLVRSVLTLTVAIAAIALGQFYAAPLAASALGSALGLSVSAAGAIISGSVMLVGTLLLTAFVPVRKKSDDAKQSPAYTVQGWRNPLNPDGAIPVVLGKHRFAPPHAAYPFTESIGDDNYVTALFCVGYGPVEISNIRIGETPIEKFINVQVQVQQGIAGETQQTLYTQQVIEEQVSVELSQARANLHGADTRFTAADSTEFSVDIQFPGGLAGFVSMNVGGVTRSVRTAFGVAFVLRIREESSAVWQTIENVQAIHATTRPFTRTFRFALPTRGRYEVELSRYAIDFDDLDQAFLPAQITSRSYWTAIRSYRPEHPLNVNFPLALIAVKVRATGQLNGMLENLSADVAAICLDWDPPTQSWIERPTRNPASLYRYALQHQAFAYPQADDEIDLAALADWHEFCAAKGLSYNRIHDAPMSILEALGDIAAAGRATPHHDGERWSVVVDRPQDVVVAHISPRNSWGFSAERSYTYFPQAFRVKFKDQTSKFGFQDAERIVLWPGFSGDPEVTEEIELPGVTDPEQVWREARRRQYELIHRRDEYVVTQDFEALAVSRGDRVQLSHDVLDRVMIAGRVKAVSAATAGAPALVVIDEFVEMEAGRSYAVRFRRKDGATLLRGIATIEGAGNALALAGDGDLPEAGDLAMIGPAGRETIDALVKAIEGGEDMTRRLTLVDHAPQISALADSDVAPPWNGRVGDDIDTTDRTPGVPSFAEIATGLRAGGAGPGSISVRAAAGSGYAPASYELQHRLAGGGGWTTISFLAGAGGALIEAYETGDAVDLKLRALSAATPPGVSAWTTVATVYVGAQDARRMNFSMRTNSMLHMMGWL